MIKPNIYFFSIFTLLYHKFVLFNLDYEQILEIYYRFSIQNLLFFAYKITLVERI